MGNNKVVLGNQTIIDMTDANVTPNTLPKGITAYDRNGDLIEGEKAFVAWSEQNVFGAKNILPNNAVSETRNGLTFTVNADKSITINGTATAATRYVINSGGFTIDQGAYSLSSGDENNRLPTSCYLTIEAPQGTNRDLVGGYFSAKIELSEGVSVYETRLWIPNGVTINNYTLYPMLTLHSAYKSDPTYKPFTMTNEQLTKRVQSIGAITRTTYSENITSGTKYTKQLTGYNASTSWIDAFINGLALQDSEFTVSAAGLFSLVNTLTGSGNTIKVIHWKQGS